MLRNVDLHRLCHREDRTLRGRVRHAACESDIRDARGHVDDRPRPLLDHVRYNGAAHQIDAADIDPHHAIKQVGLGFEHVADSADAGVIEEHVDALESFRNLVRKRDSLLLVGDVDVLGDRIAAFLANARHRRPCASIIDVSDDDVGTFVCEQPRGRLADARARAGDEADLAREPGFAHTRSVPMSRARPRAMRMIAPSTASIQVELMLERVRMLVTSDSRMTPVSAPIMRPRPPSREIPPITAAANTPKMRFEPWPAVTAVTRPACISPPTAARTLATMKTPILIRSTLIP